MLGDNYHLIEKYFIDKRPHYGVARQFIIDGEITSEVRQNAHRTLEDIARLASSKTDLREDKNTFPENNAIRVYKSGEKSYAICFDMTYFGKNKVSVITFWEQTGIESLHNTLHELPLPDYFKDGQSFVTKKVLHQI
jgi:hypothetical protein